MRTTYAALALAAAVAGLGACEKTEPKPAEPSASSSAAAAPAPAPAPAAAVDKSGPIKVGILHSLSGTMAISETSLKDVALMTIDEINAAGGVLGRKLEAGGRRPGVELAAVRGEGARSDSEPEGRGDLRLLDFGVAQVGAPGLRRAQWPALLPCAVRRRRVVVERLLHRRGAQPAGDPGRRIPDEQEGGGAKRFVLLAPTTCTRARPTRSCATSSTRRASPTTTSWRSTRRSVTATTRPSSPTSRSSRTGKRTAVISTINGDSNVPFYKELANQGLKAEDIPVVAFSVGEEELRGIDTKPLVGHLAAWNYFESIDNPDNKAFIDKWKAYVKKKNLPGGDKRVTNDPMEATYIGIQMWAQAVEQAHSTDVDAVRQADRLPERQGAVGLRDRAWTRRTTICTSRSSSARSRQTVSSRSCGRPTGRCARRHGARSSPTARRRSPTGRSRGRAATAPNRSLLRQPRSSRKPPDQAGVTQIPHLDAINVFAQLSKQ